MTLVRASLVSRWRIRAWRVGRTRCGWVSRRRSGGDALFGLDKSDHGCHGSDQVLDGNHWL